MRHGGLAKIVLLAIVTVAAAGLVIARDTPASAGGEIVTIEVGDVWFCDESFNLQRCDTEIQVGDTVVWDFSPAEVVHTTTACGDDCDSPTQPPLWDSGAMDQNSVPVTFEFTFTVPGVYDYICLFHPAAQLGRIIVGEPGLAGDVNCDGSVNSIDAALELQLGAGLLQSLECEQNGDLNDDGTINAIDAALILQIVAGLLPPP